MKGPGARRARMRADGGDASASGTKRGRPSRPAACIASCLAGPDPGALYIRSIAAATVSSVAATAGHRRLDGYVPPILLRHLVDSAGDRVRSLDASVVFADISGFTRLSERLARTGREGAEELSETIGGCL